MDESVSCVGETNERDTDAVPAGEPLGLRIEGADEPLAHRAKADQPDPQWVHRGRQVSHTSKGGGSATDVQGGLQLGGDLVGIEQADLVHRARQGSEGSISIRR